MSKISKEDKLLFAQAVEGAQPLDVEERVNLRTPTSPPKPKCRHSGHSSSITNDPQNFHFADLDPIETVSAHESLFFQRTELRKQDLKKLKKGLFQIEWRLDLHGYTEETAAKELSAFIHSAYQNGIRYTLVIHGKGYNSDIRNPVLKNMVNQSLRLLPQVLAFSSAQPKDGGQGATYVFIKQNSSISD